MNAASLVCPHRPPCPGCPRLGEAGVAESPRAALEAFARRWGQGGVAVVQGPAVGFRHRARLAVRGRVRSPKIGIFEEGSHRIVDVPRCLVHHPLVNEVASELRRAIAATRSPPYSDTAHHGLLRYVQVVIERRSRTAQVVLVTTDDSEASVLPLARSLEERLGPRLHSLFWNGNPGRHNVILGPTWKRLAGPEAVEEAIGGARVFYPPGAFGQNNLPLADELVNAIHERVPADANVLELYAGTGAIGLGLAPRASALALNEMEGESLRGLELGIAALPLAARARVRVLPGAAGSHVEEIARADVVIVDPPRKGLDATLTDALARAPPERLVYVACGRESFERDATVLLEAGRARLRELRVFDLFPHTEHVEVLAVFDRAG